MKATTSIALTRASPSSPISCPGPPASRAHLLLAVNKPIALM